MTNLEQDTELKTKTRRLLLAIGFTTKQSVLEALESTSLLDGCYRGFGINTYKEVCKWCGFTPFIRIKRTRKVFAPVVGKKEIDEANAFIRQCDAEYRAIMQSLRDSKVVK